MAPRRGTDHHSFRLRIAPPAPKPDCWRCSEDRRKLYPVGLVVEGHHIGSVLLCGPCIEVRTPLNPDPLTVDPAA